MNKNALRLFIGITSLLISGISSAEASKEQSMSMIEQAKEAYGKVEKTGFAWRDSKDMITNAEKAAKEGNYSLALDQATQALDESNNAWQQYMDNKDADKVKL